MLARKTMTFKDIQDYYYRLSTHSIAKSICVLIIAINEEFGFGRERLSRLVERYRKITRGLNDYQDEDRADAEVRVRMAEIGLQEFADAIMATHHIEKYRQEVKKMNAVSIKEAQEVQEMLKIMKGLM